MSPERVEELFSAYMATSFEASTPRGVVRLRVGEPSETLDRLLLEVGEAHWAYVTAWNPGSVALSEDENQRRNERLREDLEKAGYSFFEGTGVPDDPGWTGEASFLVLGMSARDATELGRRWGQVAVVVGTLGHAPSLARCS